MGVMGVGVGDEGKGYQIFGDGRRTDFGCEHTMIITDDVIQNCTSEIYEILANIVTTINK